MTAPTSERFSTTRSASRITDSPSPAPAAAGGSTWTNTAWLGSAPSRAVTSRSSSPPSSGSDGAPGGGFALDASAATFTTHAPSLTPARSVENMASASRPLRRAVASMSSEPAPKRRHSPPPTLTSTRGGAAAIEGGVSDAQLRPDTRGGVSEAQGGALLHDAGDERCCWARMVSVSHVGGVALARGVRTAKKREASGTAGAPLCIPADARHPPAAPRALCVLCVARRGEGA